MRAGVVFLKVDEKTIDRCERLYSDKADAYFHGFFAGFLTLAAIVVITLIAALVPIFIVR